MTSSDPNHNKTSHGFGVPQKPSTISINSSNNIKNPMSMTDFSKAGAAAAAPPPPPPVQKTSTIPKKYEFDGIQQQQLHSDLEANAKIIPDTPMTPLGKVVDSGQEQTGRWTKEEHDAFLAGLKQYGKEWKKVAAKVKTRTVVQTRTHAQKYFQKLQKGTGEEKNDYIGMESLGSPVAVANTEAKKPHSASKRRSGASRQKQAAPPPAMMAKDLQMQQQQQQQQRQNSVSHSEATHAAAQLMAQMSQFKPQSTIVSRHPPSFSPNFPPPPNRPPQPGSDQFPIPNQSIPDDLRIRSHAGAPPTMTESSPYYKNNNSNNNPKTSGMKINLPKIDYKNGGFPEPSPAACGKRKMIEMDAAQMLAGVAAGHNPLNPAAKTVFPGGRQPIPVSSTGTAHFPAMRNSAPPPSVVQNPSTTSSSLGIEKTEMGKLQIVNPEAFDGGNVGNRKRLIGQASPMTPWDGQLESLASEVKMKEREALEIDEASNSKKQSEVYDGQAQHPLSAVPARTPLHEAVCNSSLQEVKLLLDHSQTTGERASEYKTKEVSIADITGFTPLHSAVSLHPLSTGVNVAVSMTHLLLSAGSSVDAVDTVGNTPLHWAARVGNSEVVQMLVLKSCPLDHQNYMGETALHWAMRAGNKGMKTVTVLLENGARPSVFSLSHKQALDVAADEFMSVDEEMKRSRQPPAASDGERGDGDSKSASGKRSGTAEKVSIEERRQSRENFFKHSTKIRTLILHHPECLQHEPKSVTDWEAPDRINSIMKAILDKNSVIQDHEIQISTDFERGSFELLSRVHSAEYLTFVNDLSKELERRRKNKVIEQSQSNGILNVKHDPAVVPFTPMVQKTMMRESTVKKGSHSDTSFSSGSLRAARRAAGAVQHAVDRVLIGRNRNAFCVVRPPGHHAGVSGLLAGGESCGFCIFNNVAAGAMHALSDERHRPKCERCAIVDLDAHHGNGTEEIVRKCHDPGRLFFFSVHLYDNDKRKGKSNAFKFYPGTGDEDDVAHNIINVPIAPMWREKEVTQSTKPVNENRHNTRNKTKQKAAAAILSRDSVDEIPPEKAASASGSIHNGNTANSTVGSKSSPPVPAQYLVGTGREAYRRAIQQRLLPALRAFNPDLILISLGFDASRGDVGNARHYAGGRETPGIDLEPEDYAWTSRKIMEVADICCQGRVISILEGGYGRTPSGAANDGEAEKLLDKTVFSECATKHLQAMIDPYDAECEIPRE